MHSLPSVSPGCHHSESVSALLIKIYIPNLDGNGSVSSLVHALQFSKEQAIENATSSSSHPSLFRYQPYHRVSQPHLTLFSNEPHS